MAHKNDQSDSQGNLTAQAIYWCLWLEDQRRLSFKDGLQFVSWLTSSPRHVDEFLCMRRMFELMRRSKPASHEPSNVTHVNWWRGPSRQPAEMPRRRRIRGWEVAVTAAAMLPVIFFLAQMSEQIPDRAVTTAANESRTQQLEDGSIVSLSAISTLRVKFTDLRRDVHLSQGSARFSVVMDMKRPFVVNADLVDIAAVESEFAVTVGSGVEVEVYEGVAAISQRGAKASMPVITVKKGEKYRVAADGIGLFVADGKVASVARLVDG